MAYAISEEGLAVDHCGEIPTAAVMNYAIKENMAGIMVTGSQYPEDHNGINFNMPWGESLKDDEKEVAELYKVFKEKHGGKSQADGSVFAKDGSFRPGIAGGFGEINPAGETAYVQRLTSFFPARCLSGTTIRRSGTPVPPCGI